MGQSAPQNTANASLLAAHHFHQQLRSSAENLKQRDRGLQGGLVTLGILAVFLALTPCIVPPSESSELLLHISQVGLVLVGLSFLVLVVLSNRLQLNQSWLTLTSGAVSVERAIYLYRTLLQCMPDRDRWLNQQTTQIQQQLQERLVGDWLLCWGDADLSPENDITQDLLSDGYLRYRLNPQLEQATQQLTTLSVAHSRYQTTAIICAGLVVVLPILNAGWLGWSAIAAALSLGVILWLRTTSLNHQVETYSQLIGGLTLLQNHWQSLSEPGVQAFFRLVITAETLIETPYQQMGDRIRETLNLLQDNQPNPVQSLLGQPIPPALEQRFRRTVPVSVSVETLAASQQATSITNSSVNELEAAIDASVTESSITESTVAESTVIAKTPETYLPPPINGKSKSTALAAISTPTPPPAPAPTPIPTPSATRGRPHAFVVMPFGRKQGPDGRWIDFNSIYQTLIKPALEAAGLEPFRADEEASSGDILSDMFQELLLADLVVADLSIDNANVFYELGIRHALRRRGVVHIQAGRAYMPFDIFNVRTLPYHCDETGCPDPNFLEKDKIALIKMIQVTWESDRNRVHSPVFNLLTGLLEPNRKSLQTPQAIGYWKEYKTLQDRIAIAQRQKRIGDVVLLSEEVSNPLIKEDIITDAGKALTSMGHSALALKQYRQGLAINPDNINFRCAEAFHLNRLGQSDEAIVKLEQVLEDVPSCVDATTKLARIYKDLWKKTWDDIADDAERIHVAYEYSFVLQKSIENYLRGYRLDQNEYYSGINALTLTALLNHLAEAAETKSGDADEAAYRNKLPVLKGSIQFCLESSLQRSPNDYWAALSLGDLAVCTAETPQQVTTAYRKALAILWNNKYTLQTTLDQLDLMKLLQFRPEHVQAGIEVLQTELSRLENQEHNFASATPAQEEVIKPVQVFLFTGHMIDQEKRPKPRFPAKMEPEAAKRLDDVLDKLNANEHCIAIIPGLACGGDLLFAEACLKRNIRTDIYLPFESAQFIKSSVSFAGDEWVERFYKVLNHPNITLHLQPERLGPVPIGDDPYRRNNRWALYATLMHDIKHVRLIALWNGQGGDGPGGTDDMVQQVRQLGGIVEHIDTTKFNYWQSHSSPMGRIYSRLENSV